MRFFFTELLVFGWKQARACIFAGSFLFLLGVTHYLPLGGYRPDVLFLGALVLQGALLWTKVETWAEAKTIALFHLIGLCLELYKTHVGSWSYPDLGYFYVSTVPLYSGFMYASVGSYVAQAWRLFSLKLVNMASYGVSLGLCFLIYLNFFTNHFIQDFRLVLFGLVLFLYRKTWVEFTVRTRSYTMPLSLSFFLIAFFIWIAENIATFFNAWNYPDQVGGWNVVGLQKITSWTLLVILTFILVAYLKHVKTPAVVQKADARRLPNS